MGLGDDVFQKGFGIDVAIGQIGPGNLSEQSFSPDFHLFGRFLSGHIQGPEVRAVKGYLE